MSESVDIDTLTKSINHLVTSINDYISKKNTTLVQPQPVRIKKTADMTYHDFLKKALANRPPVQVAKKQSYSLQEDLELLLELSTYGTITNKCFEEIFSKKRLNRTFESIKSRYTDYLSRIGEAQMKKMVAWIQREGVQGFLSFEGNELKISLTDPKDERKVQQKKQDKKKQRAASLQASQKKVEKKKQVSKKGIPTNCKQLNEILKLYSKMVNLPIKTLLEKLDQVSGDFVQLDNYIQTKDNKLLWSIEEDQILRKEGVQVELLRKYRGSTVQTRKRYLGIN